MPSVKEIAWLAGLLEGEGAFCRGWYANPSRHNKKFFRVSILLGMTDIDTVKRAAALLGGAVCSNKKLYGTTSKKQVHTTAIVGPRAIGWMQTLYSLMGERRQKRMAECIALWKVNTPPTSVQSIGRYMSRYQ